MAGSIIDPGLQYLSIIYLPNAGLDTHGRVHFFDDLDNDFNDLGLRPLLIYNLVKPIVKHHYRVLVDPSKPLLPISQFLATAWTESLNVAERLEVRKNLITADRGFSTWLAEQGVQLAEVVSTKSLAGFDRTSRRLVGFAGWDLPPEEWHRGHLLPLDQVNAGLKKWDEYGQAIRDYKVSNDAFKAHDNHPRRFLAANTFEQASVDWDVSCIPLPPSRKVASPLRVHDDESPNFFIPEAKEIIALWASGRKVFAEIVGLTLKDLNSWLSSVCHCPSHAIGRITKFLMIEWNHDYCEWEFIGGHLLLANGRKNTLGAYNTLSHGGDLRIAREIVSPNGLVATHRVLFFEAWGHMGNIILFKADGPEAALLDNDSLINLQSPVKSTHEVWIDLLKIIDNHPLPESCLSTMTFIKRHAAWIDRLEESF